MHFPAIMLQRRLDGGTAERLCLAPLAGRVAEWLKAADCKSARVSVRRFESYPFHQQARAAAWAEPPAANRAISPNPIAPLEKTMDWRTKYQKRAVCIRLGDVITTAKTV